jgi:hypothetical protein
VPEPWKDKQLQKKFFDQLATKWNIQQPEDWHKVTKDMILNEGGTFLSTYYNGSVQRGNYIPLGNLFTFEKSFANAIS